MCAPTLAFAIRQKSEISHLQPGQYIGLTVFPVAARSAELSMPRRAELLGVERALDLLVPAVGVVGLTDNHMSRPRLSPLAAIPACLSRGLMPIVHVSCRDRNRLGQQQQVMGAAALGALGVLVVRGDRGVLPADGGVSVVETLAAVPEWADPGTLVRGVVANPFAPRVRELRLLERKQKAGIDFIQTQMVFDLDLLDSFLTDARDVLAPQVAVFASVGLIRSRRSLDFVLRSLPDCPIPEPLVQRVRSGQGVEVSTELAAEIGRRDGLRLHLIPLGGERHAPLLSKAFAAARAVSTEAAG